jgi:hypothetical protein
MASVIMMASSELSMRACTLHDQIKCSGIPGRMLWHTGEAGKAESWLAASRVPPGVVRVVTEYITSGTTLWCNQLLGSDTKAKTDDISTKERYDRVLSVATITYCINLSYHAR